MPPLYVIATPIGNLEDLTLRALRVLGEVDLIAAEDTRVTRRLLQRYDIRTPLTSYHEHNKHSKTPKLVAMLEEKSLALVSDAGMPGINDPGAELVSAAALAGVEVVPLPGPSAVTTAIAVSGLAVDSFIYVGFLPRKRGDRVKLLESLAAESRALVAFEAPHRMVAALRDIRDVLGDRGIAVCRELTKLHEEVFRGVVSEAIAHFDRPRGEFVLVVEGAGSAPAAGPEALEKGRALLVGLRADGVGPRDAVARVVQDCGLPRRQAYQLWVEVAGTARDG